MGEATLLVVMTALGDREAALEIARVLVTEKLAACVQVLPPMTSTYMWQGELCVEAECLVLIKTLKTSYEALEVKLKRLHPYQEPEILAVDAIAVSEGYRNWVMQSLHGTSNN